MNACRILIVAITLCLAATLAAKDPAPQVQPWPAKDKGEGFTIEQEGAGPTKLITITEKKTGKVLTLTADNRGEPDVLAPYNGWPQIGLINDGPPEFLWRRLYRVEDGEYDIARIDELTRIPFQAPENAPVVEISPGYHLRFLRTRVDDEIGPHSFEAFITETPSPDGKTKVRFHYEPDRLAKVDIAPAQDEDKAQLLNGLEDEFREAYGYARWRPDSGAVALYTKDAMRVGSTTLFIKQGDEWKKSDLPEVALPIGKKPKVRVRSEFVKPLRWDDDQTLVVLYHGDCYDDGEPGSYFYHATFHWGKDRKVRLQSMKAVPEPKEVN